MNSKKIAAKLANGFTTKQNDSVVMEVVKKMKPVNESKLDLPRNFARTVRAILEEERAVIANNGKASANKKEK